MVNKCISCASCGMPLEKKEDYALGNPASGYCRYCTDEGGKLLPYQQILDSNAKYYVDSQGVSADVAQRMARDLLSAQPAWMGRK